MGQVDIFCVFVGSLMGAIAIIGIYLVNKSWKCLLGSHFWVSRGIGTCKIITRDGEVYVKYREHYCSWCGVAKPIEREDYL